VASASEHLQLPEYDAGDVIVTHPNRDKPVVQATRAMVILLMLATATLVAIVTIGGWAVLEAAKPIEIAYVLVYLTMAFLAMRWNRGVLPVSAVLAVLLGIFALVAGPSWFNRDKTGFEEPALNAGLLGVLTLLLVPVQILLVAFAMRGFQQGWNVEVEQRRHGKPGSEDDLLGGAARGGAAY
jgi:presenilin-like A22 family membrane protease